MLTLSTGPRDIRQWQSIPAAPQASARHAGGEIDLRQVGYLFLLTTAPVAALQWLPDASCNLYLSAGQGFQAPTLNELACRSDGSAGCNTALRPRTSTQLEIGAKWRDAAQGLGLQAALFRADSDDEIGVLTNAGGRSSFRNVGRTRRSGAELARQWQPLPAWRAQLALSLLDAAYRDSFETCAAVPCLAPADRVSVPAGNLIAGTQARRRARSGRVDRPGATGQPDRPRLCRRGHRQPRQRPRLRVGGGAQGLAGAALARAVLMFGRPGGCRLRHPSARRALSNIRDQGLGWSIAALVQLICTLRSTRSGCGISTVKRPSAVVTAVRPAGLPLGLAG